MMKNKKITFFAMLAIAMLVSIPVVIQPSYALLSQNTQSWFTNSDTNVTATATGDVDGDGQVEIVTVGYYNDGTHWNAQLNVWNGFTLILKSTKVWITGTDTQIATVALANITGKPALDIITGGSYFDGTRWVAQLSFWNGATLALESVKTWFVTGDTQISSVVAANITGGSALEIIAGGSYFDGTRRVAQLTFWNGMNLNQDAVQTWYWVGDTQISSVAAANLTGRSALEIIAAGTYFDGTRQNAMLVFWNGATLAQDAVKTWYWTGDTQVSSITVANITGNALEVIAGGSYFDGTRQNALLAFWNGATLAQDAVKTWYVLGDTEVSSVVAANVTGHSAFDIVAGGSYNDGTHRVAQLILLDGAHLTTNSATHWFTTSDTQINSVAVGDFGEGNRAVTGGSYYDNIRANAQIVTWT
jgi:hypothetical protein